jgi:hypothetical protein
LVIECLSELRLSNRQRIDVPSTSKNLEKP